MKSNKQTRKIAEKKVLRRRNADLGWPTQEEIPIEREKAIMKGGIRISQQDDKKRFGKTSKKRHYGHFSGYAPQRHLPAKKLRERAKIRDAEKESEDLTNS